MATGNCWTLWQRLPPRYQLTTQEMAEDEDDVMGSRQCSPMTPRSSRAGLSTPRSSQRSSYFRGTTFGGIPPHTSDERLRSFLDRKKLAFPSRNSRYISNMKSQQRVTSAKQKITKDPSIVTYIPSMRPRLSPSFPVTKLSNLQKATVETKEYTANDRNLFYPANSSEGGGGLGSARVVAVHNIFPFDDSKSLARQSSRNQNKRYLVNDLQDATMFIDHGKVIYFKKTRPDMTQTLVEAIGPYSAKRDDGSYIAHLRKAYLKNPRDMAKTKRDSEVELKQVQQERCDYDKRVGHILEYYSYTDDKHRPNTSEAEKKAPQRQRSGSPRPRLRTPSPRGPRLRSLLSTSVPQPQQQATGIPQPQRSMDTFEEWSLYLKLNQQAVLHEKQFYLRTPGIRVLIPGVQNINPGDVASCKCRLCQVEMELSMIAQMNQMGITGMPREKTECTHAAPKPEVPDVECPGRPNSASIELVKEANTVSQSLEVEKVDTQPKPPGEQLTVKLPEITEEREASDVSAAANNQTLSERKAEPVDDTKDVKPEDSEWSEGGLAGTSKAADVSTSRSSQTENQGQTSQLDTGPSDLNVHRKDVSEKESKTD